MPKFSSVLIISLLITLTGLTVFALEQKMMSIQVRKGTVRSVPSFLGNIVAQLEYGDRVAVRGVKDSWFFIEKPQKSTKGWMHSSALSMKKIVLK